MIFQNPSCSFSVVHFWFPGGLAFFSMATLCILIPQKVLQRCSVHWSHRAMDVIDCWVICPFTTARNWTSRVEGGSCPTVNTVPARPFSRPTLFSRRVQADEGGWPPLCSNQLPAQVKSKGGALLWTTTLAEWLGLTTLKSGFQPSPTILGPRILRVLPCLCDHAKSADRKQSLSKFLFYVTFIYKAQSTSKEWMLTTPHSSICYFCKKDFFFFFKFFPSLLNLEIPGTNFSNL